MLLGLLIRLGSSGRQPLNLGEIGFQVESHQWSGGGRFPPRFVDAPQSNFKSWREKNRKGGRLPQFMRDVSGHIGSAFALVSLESTAFHWVTPAATTQPWRRKGEERKRRQWHFQLSVCWNVAWPRRQRRVLHRRKATLSVWPGLRGGRC